jgi:ribosomal protein L7/L12
MQTGIEMRCPKCHSARIIVHKDGAASSIADHISLLEGSVDNTAIRLICQQCGAVFPPSEAKMGQHTGFDPVQSYTGNTIHPDEQQIRNIAKEEGPVAAIKYVKDTYGWGLNESKDFVSKVMQENAPVHHTSMQPADEVLILKIVKEQGKLQAVKYCKDNYNLGLKDAKDYVDGILTGKGIVQPAGKTGCFIATACYGDYDAPEVKVLRRYRDQVMAHSATGRVAIRLYYWLSPGLAAAIRQSPRAQTFIRTYLLNGLVQRIAKTKA